MRLFNTYFLRMTSLLLGVGCLGSLLFPHTAHAQCRETTAWESAWTSCQTSPSPNTQRGAGHWLHYDLGHVYTLTDLHIWNANHADHLTRGVREMTLDYSMDGTTWTEWGSFTLAQGAGTDYYPGETVADLASLQARYVLLSVKNTWGDLECASLHEVSFGLEYVALPAHADVWVYPNPAIDEISIAFDRSANASDQVELRILNLMGQQVHDANYSVGEGRQAVEVAVTRFNPGVYIVQVFGDNQRLLGTQKFIIRR